MMSKFRHFLSESTVRFFTSSVHGAWASSWVVLATHPIKKTSFMVWKWWNTSSIYLKVASSWDLYHGNI
jgi:hypothetical protein